MLGRKIPHLMWLIPEEEGESRSVVSCTSKIVCPGWEENVKCLSFGGTNATIDWKSCDPRKKLGWDLKMEK